MDGVSRAIGAGTPVWLGGEMYFLAPMTLGVIGAIENYILLRRMTPFESIEPIYRATQDATIRQRLVDNANAELKADPLKRIVRQEDFHSFIDTDEGIVLTAWLCFRDTEPEAFKRFGKFQEVWRSATQDEKVAFIKARNHISGLSMLCLLDWPQEADKIPAHVLAKRKKIASDTYQRANWRLNFNRIAKGYTGMTFEDLRQMTLYQVRMICVKEDELEQADVVTVTAADAKKNEPRAKQKLIFIGRDGSGVDEFVRASQGRKQS